MNPFDMIGWIANGLGSPVGGLATNIAFSGENYNRFQDFLNNQVGPLNQQILGGINNLGALGRQAQGFMTGGIQKGTQLFNQDAAANRFNSLFGGVNQGLGQLANRAGVQNNAVNQQVNSAIGQFGAGQNRLNQGFQGQLMRARGMASQLGQQELRDINSAFDAQAGTNQANLAARGLGSATVGQSQGAMLQRQRQDALGASRERTLQSQLGVESLFGNAALGAQERGFGNLANLQFQGAGMRQQGNQFASNLGLGALGQLGQNMGLGLENLNFAGQAQLGNMLNFGGFGIGTNLATQQAALDALGPYNLIAPPMVGGVGIQPSVR